VVDIEKAKGKNKLRSIAESLRKRSINSKLN
jgi:hypothetical protein